MTPYVAAYDIIRNTSGIFVSVRQMIIIIPVKAEVFADSIRLSRTFEVIVLSLHVHRYCQIQVDTGGPVVIILATGSEVRGFKPGQGRWIVSERKNPEYDFLRKLSKVVGPVS